MTAEPLQASAPPGDAPAAPTPVPAAALLVPFAALLAVAGAAVPWFRPHAAATGHGAGFGSLYSFRDGRVGLLVPIALLIASAAVLTLFRRSVGGLLAERTDPVRAAGCYAVAGGLVALASAVAAWFLVTGQYRFRGADGRTLDWDSYAAQWHALGGSLTRGPLAGYWLSVVAGALAVIGGVLMVLRPRPSDR